MENVQVGQLVRSSAGRDKGNIYLVYDLLDEAFVRVIDGVKKKLTNPKRKNIKHLEIFPVKADCIAEKLIKGELVTEKEISETIKTLGLSHIN
ncbi:RNA-binding protein [Phosphitispora sp. TUW77]|uniref:RNA-binding protein n=1 Tax=Phosphitispora sp. TUW77 TaxID=3152361 RepID=UPI003AB3B85D